MVRVTAIEEAQSVAAVATRMRERFPHVSPNVIDGRVGELYHQFDETPIRDFIPVLIENDAINWLTHLPRQRAAARGSASEQNPPTRLARGPLGASTTTWSDDLELTGQPASAYLARDFVRRNLVAQGLAHLVDDVTLVVSELATNAVVHAQTTFIVSLQGFEQTLLLEVVDGSRTGPVDVSARVLDTSGRGLTIVTLLSRAWGVDALTDGGKSVWAEFDLS